MSGAWAPHFEAVDRARFLPDLMWPFDMESRTSRIRDRAKDPARWYADADADVPVTTQWDDGRHGGPGPGRVPTSSASMPGVVMAMLGDLDVHEGQRVLEVGTGTGWNAGLLAHRLGDRHIVTMEVDEAVAHAARRSLDRAGLHPAVITGDGLLGHPPGAPYDRVIATAGLRRIPYAWVEQTVPGGLIVAPWGTRFTNADQVVRLVVADDGSSASGSFTAPVEFMKVRSHRHRVDQSAYLPDGFPSDATASTTSLTAADAGFEDSLRHPFTAVAGFLVPECTLLSDRRGSGLSVWLYGLTDRSWAAAVLHDDVGRSTVHQSGARRLWDELTAAHRWWTSAGRPAATRFGLTVGAEGETVWLDAPGAVLPRPGLRAPAG